MSSADGKIAGSWDTVVARIATVVVVVCVLALGLTAVVVVSPAARGLFGWPAEEAASYHVGETIDVDRALYVGSERTVLLFARSSCGACQRSKPMMASLTGELARQTAVQVVLVTPVPLTQDERTFAREVGVDEARLVRVDAGALRIRYVPTAVVVDRQGMILFAREGVMTEADRRALADIAIKGNPGSRRS